MVNFDIFKMYYFGTSGTWLPVYRNASMWSAKCFLCMVCYTSWFKQCCTFSAQIHTVRTLTLEPFPHVETSLTDSLVPGKSGIATRWKALRAFSDALRQAHAILGKRRANISPSVWYLPEACILHLRSRPKYQNILRMSSGPASRLSSEDKPALLITQGVQFLVMCGTHMWKKE